ncbi:MAG: phage holin family protein [Candidatus Sumerlaeaceae bacterium]
MHDPEINTDYTSIPSLLRDLRDQATTLLRQEVALARAEITEKTDRAARNFGILMLGALTAFAGFVILLMAAVAGIAIGLGKIGQAHNAPWLAPLIVGGLVTLIGIAFVQKAKISLKRTTVVPEQTVRTMKENQQWIASKVS